MSDAYVFNLVGSNSHAVRFWLQRNGVNAEYFNANVSADKDKILVVPGVLSFDSAIRQLGRVGGDKYIRAHVESGGRVIGICCGMQIFFDSSEEGEAAGLGILKGACTRMKQGDDAVPNVGWTGVDVIGSGSFRHLEPFNFYFMHSFAVFNTGFERLEGDCSVLTGSCNGKFCAGIISSQFLLTQFHPEKSYTNGDRLLKSFVEYE